MHLNDVNFAPEKRSGENNYAKVMSLFDEMKMNTSPETF
jgi:hypothetical protein